MHMHTEPTLKRKPWMKGTKPKLLWKCTMRDAHCAFCTSGKIPCLQTPVLAHQQICKPVGHSDWRIQDRPLTAAACDAGVSFAG